MLGTNLRLESYGDPTVFNVTLPVSGGILYAVLTQRPIMYINLLYSGKDVNDNTVTGQISNIYDEGTYTANLGEIVSNISANADQFYLPLNQLYATTPEVSANGVHELAWKNDIPALPENMFTGYNTLVTGGHIYNASIDTDIRFSADNNIYSLTGISQKVDNLKGYLDNSNTLSNIDSHYEMCNKAYRTDILGISGSQNIISYGGYIGIYFGYPYDYIDTVYLTFDATQSGTRFSNDWVLYSHSGNQYTFAKYLKIGDDTQNFNFEYNDWDWQNITNITASASFYNNYGIKELAFKDDLTGAGGGVPQSAFDELKQSYDALSSLFATYSGKWLLPNEGV